MSKVFCKLCYNLIFDEKGCYVCDCPENRNNWFAEDSKDRSEITSELLFLKSPHEINKNNDCKWFDDNAIKK